MMISLIDETGPFAENKERAKSLRTRSILPAVKRGEDVTLDFDGVYLTTQSFVHALVATAIRDYDGLDHLVFKNCDPNVRSIIEIVVSYCQENWGEGVQTPEV
ncbi:DUF4325 domain-containing protein [Cellulomonas hominis]|uniref:DUF4325 domain-containing protein n=2 Tax=Cellulomonas hominis TaxID=156981 RepID=A0A7Z8NQR5_9CELL|nr:DUF4325 domain-containing protein [Cellulomonas hominis]